MSPPRSTFHVGSLPSSVSFVSKECCIFVHTLTATWTCCWLGSWCFGSFMGTIIQTATFSHIWDLISWFQAICALCRMAGCWFTHRRGTHGNGSQFSTFKHRMSRLFQLQVLISPRMAWRSKRSGIASRHTWLQPANATRRPPTSLM